MARYLVLIVLLLLNTLTEYQLHQMLLSVQVLDAKHSFYHAICSFLRISWVSLCAWFAISLPVFLIGLLILLYLNVIPYRSRLFVMRNITMIVYLIYLSLLILCIGCLGIVGIDFLPSKNDTILYILVINITFVLHNFICFFLLKYRPEFLWNDEYDHLKVVIYTCFLSICIVYQILDTFVLEYCIIRQIDYLLLIGGDILILILVYNLSNYNYVFIKSEKIKNEYEASEVLMAQQYFEKQRLKQLSEYDALTKALNRREISLLMEEGIDKGQKIICVFIDLDGLKKVNDRYGHNFGDIMLKRFVEACEDIFKKMGYLARIGGDEFLLVFFNQELAFIESRLEELQTLLLDVKEEQDRISFSYGISFDEHSVEDYMTSADQKMYICKNRKRCDGQ